MTTIIQCTKEDLKQIINEEVRAALSEAIGSVKSESQKELITTEEAARIAGKTPRTIQAWAKVGRITPVHFGNSVRYDKAEVVRNR